MDIRLLCEVMAENNLSQKDIDKLMNSETIGFSLVSGQELAEEIYAKIEEILKHGVNSGFNKSMENAISVLASIIVQIISSSSPIKINNLRREFEVATNPKNLKMEKLPKYSKGSPFEVLEEVVNISGDVCKVMGDRQNTKLNKEFFQSSLDIFNQMKAMLPELWDVTSYDAALKIGEIGNKCMDWLEPAGHGALSRSDVTNLQGALKEMESLQKMRKHRDATKDGILTRYELSGYKDMIRKDEFEEELENLKQTVKLFEKNIAKIKEEYPVGTTRQEIDKLMEQAQAIVAKMDNGEIEEEDGEFQLEMLDEEIEAKQEMLNAEEETRRTILKTSRSRQRIINSVKSLINLIDISVTLNNSPAVLAAFMSEINSGPINAVLSGTLNDADNDKFEEAIQKATELSERLKKLNDDAAERIQSAREKTKAEMRERYPQKDHKREGESLASKYRKKNLNEEKNKDKKKDPAVIDPFDDSDL